MNPITLGIIRHLITALGAAGAAEGYMTDSDVQAIAGAIVTLIGFALSVWHKYQEKKKQA